MEQNSSSTLKNVLIIIAVILAMTITFFLGRATAPKPEAAPAPSDTTQSQDEDGSAEEVPLENTYAESLDKPELLDLLHAQPKREEGDARALGATDAPVVMVAFEDFSCPMCTVFFTETFPELKSMVEAGQLRIEFRDLVIFPNYGSDKAARAGRAAANQGMFWEFTTTAYDDAGAGNHPSYDDARIMEIAETIGIPDMAKFEADYNSEETAAAVEAETQQGMIELGIGGTPFFIINNAVISGAQPTEYFVNTIQHQLEEAN